MESIANDPEIASLDPDRPHRDLVERWRRGEQAAAAELVEELGPMVFRIGLRLTGRREDAEDLSQEVFLRAFRSLADYRGDASLRSWIAAIALNVARTRIGRLVRLKRTFVPVGRRDDEEDAMERLIEQTPDRPEEGPEARLLAHERRRFLREAIRSLPSEFREAVVLRDQEGLSYDEIARSLGVPLGTVRSRLARGRAQLAHRLRELVGPDAWGGTT